MTGSFEIAANGAVPVASASRRPSFGDQVRSFFKDPIGSIAKGLAPFAQRLGVALDFTAPDAAGTFRSPVVSSNMIAELVVTAQARLDSWARDHAIIRSINSFRQEAGRRSDFGVKQATYGGINAIFQGTNLITGPLTGGRTYSYTPDGQLLRRGQVDLRRSILDPRNWPDAARGIPQTVRAGAEGVVGIMRSVPSTATSLSDPVGLADRQGLRYERSVQRNGSAATFDQTMFQGGEFATNTALLVSPLAELQAGRMAVGAEQLAARGASSAAENVVPEGVVYLRTDVTGKLAPYGGQAINDARFVARQAEHARAFPESKFKFTIIDRANPGSALDIAEHNFIQELTGGVAARRSPVVSNVRDPVGAARRPAFGLPEPK